MRRIGKGCLDERCLDEAGVTSSVFFDTRSTNMYRLTLSEVFQDGPRPVNLVFLSGGEMEASLACCGSTCMLS